MVRVMGWLVAIEAICMINGVLGFIILLEFSLDCGEALSL